MTSACSRRRRRPQPGSAQPHTADRQGPPLHGADSVTYHTAGPRKDKNFPDLPQAQIGFVFADTLLTHLSYNPFLCCHLASFGLVPNWLCSAHFASGARPRAGQIGFVLRICPPAGHRPRQPAPIRGRASQIGFVLHDSRQDASRLPEIGFVLHAWALRGLGVPARLLPSPARNWLRFARFTPQPSHAPHVNHLCPHTPVPPSLASFCTISCVSRLPGRNWVRFARLPPSAPDLQARANGAMECRNTGQAGDFRAPRQGHRLSA
jgi:hypothetical protein